MRLALALILLAAAGVSADELRRADELAWSRRFEEAEALYRALLPSRPEARLGLARVVMWQGRYREAIALFDAIEPPTIDALEGRATAAYWSGDYRAAARGFRRVLALDPTRELAAKSLREIESTARPSQSVTVNGVRDDQPLDAIRVETAATFFSDPLTKWTARAGTYRVEGRRGELALIENETAFPQLRIGASLGLFEFPDGVVRPIGAAHVRVRAVTLGIARREEVATLAALRTHIATTTTALRWDHDRTWLAAIEASHRAYSDGNDGWGVSAWAIFPLLRRDGWTFWSGASAMMRDTRESRFADGRYDPYWTPEDLREARAVMALELASGRGKLKIHGDAGRARDRDRDDRPFRAGLAAELRVAAHLALAFGIERSATIDYRANTIHATLVRRP